MEIKYYSRGACGEVTGSKHFLEFEGKVLQLDCGMFQGRREESYKKNSEIKSLPMNMDALILSHAHFDHSGALPILTKSGFNGNIYSTSATRDIANIILMDSAFIQQNDYEYLSEKAQKYPQRDIKLYEPLYDSTDVINTLNNFVTVNYHREFYPLPNLKCVFHDAGHILGSAFSELTFSNGIKVVFSGDLGRKKLPIIKDPEAVKECDYLVMESTYGNRLHKSIGFAEEDLAEVINKAYKRGGKIVIPAFTIERTQELIYIIHKLNKEKKVPAIKVFIDSPMAVNATSIFKIHPECFDKETFDDFISQGDDPFGFDNIRYVSSSTESKKLNKITEPIIIISASGMCENGRILHHLKNNLEDKKNIIAMVGYMAQHTLGRKLIDGHKEVKIFNKIHKVEAEIEILNSFSGHADYNELSDWVKNFDLNRLKKIFLVHGEEEAQQNLRKVLLDMGVNDVEITVKDKEYILK